MQVFCRDGVFVEPQIHIKELPERQLHPLNWLYFFVTSANGQKQPVRTYCWPTDCGFALYPWQNSHSLPRQLTSSIFGLRNHLNAHTTDLAKLTACVRNQQGLFPAMTQPAQMCGTATAMYRLPQRHDRSPRVCNRAGNMKSSSGRNIPLHPCSA